MTLEDGDIVDNVINELDDPEEQVDQLYWNTKTEMLSIVEEDLKLKLELKELRKQFLTILQDFKKFDNCTDTEELHKATSVNHRADIKELDDQNCENSPDITEQNQKPIPFPQIDMNCTDQLDIDESNNSSFLSEINPLPDADVEEEYINKYFAGLQILPDAGTSESEPKSSSIPMMSNGSSYGDLTAPNQTAASESATNWDNIYINNLSKQEDPDPDYKRQGAKPKRLKVYIQNIPWDTSSDSSYNVPCPDTKPQLHPELQKALLASRNAKSTSSMESSLANISDITKYSEMSSRWVHSQNASDYNSCSPEDLPHQSTPTKCHDIEPSVPQRSQEYIKRVSPTGGTHQEDTGGQFATPVGRVQGSDFCSSLDDSTPIVIPRTRRHLFPGEDSGITGSASDYTSSPSTMRENSNIQTGGPKMDRDKFLLMDENRTFNLKCAEKVVESCSRDLFLINNQMQMSMEVTRDSEANVADVTDFSIPDGSLQNSCDVTSSSSNISPMTSGVGSSYKESDGKSSPFTESIDMALRTTIDGEEGYNQMVANLKVSNTIKIASLENTPINRQSSATRPPCIGKEATPENNAMRKHSNYIANITSPTKDISKEILLHNNNNSSKDISSDSSSSSSRPPLPGYNDLKKKALAPPEKPSFSTYDGGDSIVKPVVVNEEEVSSKEVINVDQYAKSISPTKDGRKKTFFKKLKGIRKHFRSNSRSKAYVKSD